MKRALQASVLHGVAAAVSVAISASIAAAISVGTLAGCARVASTASDGRTDGASSDHHVASPDTGPPDVVLDMGAAADRGPPPDLSPPDQSLPPDADLTPTMLAQLVNCQAMHLTTDSAYVYFTVQGCAPSFQNGVYLVPRVGGTAATMLEFTPDSGNSPDAIVNHGGELFFTDDTTGNAGSLWYAFTSGTPGPGTLQHNLKGPTSLMVDKNFVAWTEHTGACIDEVPFGSATATPTQVACSQVQPNQIVNAIDLYLYWDDGDGSLWFANQSPPYSPYAMAGAGTLAAPAGLAVDSGNDYLYVADAGHGQILAVDLRSCPTLMPAIATGLRSPDALHLDEADGYLYFTDVNLGWIERVPAPNGGTIQVLARGQNQPDDVTVDGEQIFWTNQGDGSVWEMARPH
jgi:hypothetical protein